MSRQIWKPGNMLYPLPAVMVSTADKEGNSNIITIAWNRMYESGDGIYFCSSGALFLSYDKRKRGVCDQSDDRKIDKSDRLLWSSFGRECR